jgi:hypothetical protein
VTPARAYIKLTNLFNGDPILGEWRHSARRHTYPVSAPTIRLFNADHLYTLQTSTGNRQNTISLNTQQVNL